MNRSKTSLAVVLFVLAGAVPAFAHEEPPPLEVVDALAAIIQDDSASWDDKWQAYKAAKVAIDAEKEASVLPEGEKGPAEIRYDEIQGDVADALRRETLPVSGWVMGFFAASLLWGGLGACLAIARKSGRRVDPEAQ